MKKILSFVTCALVAIAANATDYYFAGAANGWSNSSTQFVEDQQVAGTYYAELADFYGDFKVCEDKNWHPQYGASAEGDSIEFNVEYTMAKEATEGGEAMNLGVKLSGDYRYKDAKLKLVVDGGVLKVTLVAGTLYDHSKTAISYYLIGACTNNWSLPDAIEFVDVEGVFTANVPDLNGTFKIIYDRAWGKEYASNGTGVEFNKDYALQLGGGNLALANPFGGYTNAVLTLDTAQKVLKLISGTFYVTENNWYFPGTKLGWNCNETTQFTPVQGKDNTYEFLAAELSGDFKVVYGVWAVEFGANKTEDTWTINTPYLMTYPCAGNFNPADATATYQDVTATIVVDYEKAEVTLTLASEVSGLKQVSTIDLKSNKVIRDGKVFIQRGDKIFNVLGTEVE